MILNLAQGGVPQKAKVVWVNQDYGKSGAIADFPAQTLTFSGKFKGYYISFRDLAGGIGSGSPADYSIKYVPLTETRIATGYVKPYYSDGGPIIRCRAIDRVTENSITFHLGSQSSDWGYYEELSAYFCIPMKIWGVPFAI